MRHTWENGRGQAPRSEVDPRSLGGASPAVALIAQVIRNAPRDCQVRYMSEKQSYSMAPPRLTAPPQPRCAADARHVDPSPATEHGRRRGLEGPPVSWQVGIATPSPRRSEQ